MLRTLRGIDAQDLRFGGPAARRIIGVPHHPARRPGRVGFKVTMRVEWGCRQSCRFEADIGPVLLVVVAGTNHGVAAGRNHHGPGIVARRRIAHLAISWDTSFPTGLTK